MDVKFNQAAAAYSNASQMKGSLKTPQMPGEGESNGFGDMLEKSFSGAASNLYESEKLTAGAVAGKVPLGDLVTSVANADLTLQTVVAIRDKMISAYQDILKMPI